MQIHGETDRHPPTGSQTDLAHLRRSEKNPYTGAVIAFSSSIAILVLDLWTKAAFFPIAKDSSWSILGGFVRLIEFHNYGISFNIPLPFFLTAIIAVGALIWAVYTLLKLPPTDYRLPALLGIFIGGVLGNFSDRIFLGFVRDWLLLWDMSAVNLADGAILIGLVGYLLLTKPAKK